ncbi:AMP-binding protein [Reyranella sp. CPCC 100927]|uniref:AMP-binding protein n=1 Tax=Reyranella sp. CPCC 100927 TaxID=2599616 RepID=UPI0011B85012|nr:AMP-binding protein [Reyranella sp. CPCC 100927]TWT13580.1 AMP-binding protein [Reyranella sp. CPCC 100927]
MMIPDISAQTTPAALAMQADKRAARPFVRMMGAPFISFGEMELRTRRLANALAELGVSHGDRVLVMMRNSTAFIETWLAVNRLGAVLVTVNTAYTGAFLVHVANNSAARVMVIDASFLPRLLEVEGKCSHLRTVIVAPQAPRAPDSRLTLLAFDEVRHGRETGIDVRVTGSDIGAIIYTSGTTGPSKGVLIPHAQIYFNPLIYIEQLGLTADDRVYTCLPLFHTNALIVQVFGALLLGAPVSMAEIFSASGWVDDIRASDATVTNLLGVMTEFIFKQPETPRDREHNLRIATAVPISPVFGEAFEQRFGVQLIELYGSTEANCPLYMPRDIPRRDGSCGKIVDDWFECRIADPETDAELPPDCVGELQIRPRAPHAFMAGYNAMPEETVKAWRNLWFHTGDAMKRDADGFYYFIDRLKDCIRRRSENISSYEIEQVILTHPAVLEAAVVGIASPTEAGEQEVKACVVLRPQSVLSPQALFAFCEPLVPRFAVPRFIEIYGELPKTPTQKVRKQELRAHGVRQQTWQAPAPPRSRPDSRLPQAGERR